MHLWLQLKTARCTINKKLKRDLKCNSQAALKVVHRLQVQFLMILQSCHSHKNLKPLKNMKKRSNPLRKELKLKKKKKSNCNCNSPNSTTQKRRSINKLKPQIKISLKKNSRRIMIQRKRKIQFLTQTR